MLENKEFSSAKLRMLKTSPQKLNLIADLIRGKDVFYALTQLKYCSKRVAKNVEELLKSAIANAENNHYLDLDSLYVKEVRVGKAMVMKRFRARARGRGAKILKPFSNIEIILAARS